MITLKRLKKVLDGYFGPPFLPAGTVTTSWSLEEGEGRCLAIKVGRRDVLLAEDGRVIAAGTEIVEVGKGQRG